MANGRNRGTLIAAIAVALGIAAFVGYQFMGSERDHEHRAKVSEAIALLYGAREPLVNHFKSSRQWPSALEGLAPATSGKYTQSVAISKGAGGTSEIEVTATMRPDGGNTPIAGKRIQLTSADEGASWKCGSPDLSDIYLPPACRKK